MVEWGLRQRPQKALYRQALLPRLRAERGQVQQQLCLQLGVQGQGRQRQEHRRRLPQRRQRLQVGVALLPVLLQGQGGSCWQGSANKVEGGVWGWADGMQHGGRIGGGVQEDKLHTELGLNNGRASR